MGHDTYGQDLYQLLLDIFRSNPRASEAEVREELWGNIKDKIDFYRLLFDNWFIPNHRLLRDRLQVKPDGTTVYKAPTRKHSSSRPIKRAVQAIRNLVIMDLTMPNGKQLRDCTFAELGTLSNWARDLCKHGKPSEVVGKKLTEKQVWAVWTRHAQKNPRPTPRTTSTYRPEARP